ncbi:MAG TPA: hypothetical protein VFB51_06025 [Solirubrobacterales bacterium]|nr:hypothetical protein [Solirubrobacterales bacterium]
MAAGAGSLPELEAVAWRRRIDERSLRLRERISAAYTALYITPLLVVAAVLVLIEPLLAPIALVGLFLAWVVPELFANRGAVVVRVSRRRDGGPERVAQGLLGDLLGHDERELQRHTGLAMERGRLGVWLVSEAGALLVRPGGRCVHAFCVRVADGDLPPSDRIAHLLLALREDEEGFATVANHAFVGATWRMRRRIPAVRRPALDAAAEVSRAYRG